MTTPPHLLSEGSWKANVYRENEKGTSKFIPFVDIKNYPQVFVRGGLGEAMLDESLLNLIKCPSEKKDYSWMEDF